MPSPIAHTAIGYLVFRSTRQGVAQKDRGWVRPTLSLLVATIGFSILPDLDSVAAVLTGDFGRFHNNWTHSLIVGLGVALMAGCIMRLIRHSEFKRWFFIALVCYELHIIMDFFTVGRGVMAFWPLSLERFASPVPLFYGLHWSDGYLSKRHLVTLVTELGFLFLLGIIMHFWPAKKGRVNFFRRIQENPLDKGKN